MKEKEIVTSDQLKQEWFETKGNKFADLQIRSSEKQMILLTTKNEIYMMFDKHATISKGLFEK